MYKTDGTYSVCYNLRMQTYVNQIPRVKKWIYMSLDTNNSVERLAVLQGLHSILTVKCCSLWLSIRWKKNWVAVKKKEWGQTEHALTT